MEERVPMTLRTVTAATRTASVLTALAAAVLAGCASTPAANEWPMVPAHRVEAVPAAPPAASAPATTPPVAAPASTEDSAALASQPPPAPAYTDLFDRIRAGYGLGQVDQDAVDRELRFFVSKPDYLNRTFERAERYLYYVVQELESRHMPLELSMLPVVESAYNPYAYSRARAAGIWQFIAPTATRYQVRVNWWQDGRRDILDSTRAALDYLQVLHDQFNHDWLLALAAYNCGEACVQRAIDRNVAAGLPTDYWSLKLPAETRAYAPRLLAMAQLLANPAEYGLAFAPIANEPYFARVEVGSQIDLRVAAALAGVTEEELHALNPAFNRWATDPEGPHHLLVPYAIAPQFQAAVAQMAPSDRMPLERYRVRRGDTVVSLAKLKNIPPAAIGKLNGLTSTRLPVGEEVLLPGSASVAPLRAGLIVEGETPMPGKRHVLVVRRGDTLYKIARRNHVDVRQLARMNGLKPNAHLTAGRHLVVGAMPASTKASRHGKHAAHGARSLHYTVRSGDTLHEISRKFDVSIAQLREWNRLPGASIRPGQKLVVKLNNDYGG
jgi:membrane-bound lytic murein transglycosylase D